MIVIVAVAVLPRYYKKEYSMHGPTDHAKFKEQIAQLEECARLTTQARKRKRVRTTYTRPAKPERKRPVYVRPTIALNQTDSMQLVQVRGIGPAFARRILRYREMLGGYLESGQLLEVYGLDSARLASFQAEFQVDAQTIRPININAAPFSKLAKHPYIRRSVANWIIRYREQHGAFQDVGQIKTSYLINDSTYRRIAPYLVVK